MSQSDPYGQQQYGGQYPQYGGQQQYGGQYPQYGQPQPGQYPPGQQWGPPPDYPRGTNTLAILSLVFAFVFAPAGVVLGFIALKQVRERREGGRGLAIAGIIVGIVSIVLSIIAIIAVVAAAKNINDSVTSNRPAPVSSAGTGTGDVTTSCRQVLGLVKQAENESDASGLRRIGEQLRSYDNTTDSSYNQHVDTLATAYSDAADAVDNGQTPNASALRSAGYDVGFDCGKRGVTING